MDIKEDDIDLASKNLDTKSRVRDMLLEHIFQLNRLFENELLLSLREIRFSIQKFATGILISNIKYNHLGFQINNTFYLFYD